MFEKKSISSEKPAENLDWDIKHLHKQKDLLSDLRERLASIEGKKEFSEKDKEALQKEITALESSMAARKAMLEQKLGHKKSS